MSKLARFEVSPDQIDAVVAAFYADVRAHPMLGRVFAEKVDNWPAHETKIAAFWRGAILFEAGYDGNPMRTHKEAGNVRPGMFSTWLDVFDAVLARELPEETAAAWSALAHRIGAGLRYGLVEQATHSNGVPDLRG